MKEVVMVDLLRTPFSRSRPTDPERDVFNNLRMDQALADVMNELLNRNDLEPDLIDDFFVGSAFPVDEQWSYGGRHPVFLAGWPVEVPAAGVDRQCASSETTIRFGSMAQP